MNEHEFNSYTFEYGNKGICDQKSHDYGLKTVCIKKETSAQLFCQFCKISKNTFSYRTPPVVASAA